MDLTRDNVDTAADPQAITTLPPPKQPVSNNDPTRDISPRQGVDRVVAVGLGVVGVLVMAVATIWMFVGD